MKKLLLTGVAALSLLNVAGAHAQQGNLPKPVGKLPPYPPVVCVTPNWTSEPCESRKADRWEWQCGNVNVKVTLSEEKVTLLEKPFNLPISTEYVVTGVEKSNNRFKYVWGNDELYLNGKPCTLITRPPKPEQPKQEITDVIPLPRSRPKDAPLVLPDEMAIYYDPGYFPKLGFRDIQLLFRGPLLPPVKYDHPYQGRLRIINAGNQEDAQHMCLLVLKAIPRFANAPDPGKIAACAIRRDIAKLDPNVDCVVIRTDPSETYAINVLMRHEIGHCNGWDTHDGMRSSLSSEELEQGMQRDWK